MERVTITLDELNALRKEMQDRGVESLTVNIGLWSDTGLVNLQEVIHEPVGNSAACNQEIKDETSQ